MGSMNLEERGDFLIITLNFQGKTAYLTATGFSFIPEEMDWRNFPGILLWKKANRQKAEQDYKTLAKQFGIKE